MDALGIAAALTHDFPDLPVRVVVRSVRRLVDQLPYAAADEILTAARLQLVDIQTEPELTQPDGLAASRHSPVASLHDGGLEEDVVLMAHLIIAARDIDGPLEIDRVDRILGLR